jgi:5-methylcytosine-specific restriction endonuclease McrA
MTRSRSRALVLNASFEPHQIIPDFKAVRLYMKGKVEVVEYSEHVFHSPGSRFQPPTDVMVPSVMRLHKYVDMPNRNKSILLNTRNVLARDQYVCSYCGGVAQSMDHVHPKGTKTMTALCTTTCGRLVKNGPHFGPHVWENVVAACRKCNAKKDDRTLDELGWVLQKMPRRPLGVQAQLLNIAPQPEWYPYLGIAA